MDADKGLMASPKARRASRKSRGANVDRFYVEPFRTTPNSLPIGIEMMLFVKTSGDTVGVVRIERAGGFALWRDGSCVGTFDSLLDVYRKLDRLGE